MGILYLPDSRSYSQEQEARWNLAITYLATLIVHLTLFSVPLHLRPQAQEQQGEKEKALQTLQKWKQTAIQLGRPPGSVQWIQDIIEDYGQGKPLT